MQSNGEIRGVKIKEKALELGFSQCGITAATPLEPERENLQRWLDNGMNGAMHYMANHFEKRLNPSKLVPGAKSVISVVINYFPDRKQTDPEAPVIAKYAYGKDYHCTVKEKLNNLLIFIQNNISPCNGRAFVDSAPVLERPLARRAGLGWIGKNSLLITKQFGSYLFIGELIIDLELQSDAPFTGDYCGTCTRCIDSCPTGAIVSPYVIDANKCISYHTIESKEQIPAVIREQLKNQIFGCDICQDVCPWNKKAKPNYSSDFMPITGLLEMQSSEWINLKKETFMNRFRHSAFERAGYEKLMANIRHTNHSD